MADPLHETAISGNHIGEVIHQIIAKPRLHHALAKRHADRCRDPLAQRPGRRLDPLGMAIFRMPRRARSPLAEITDLLHIHVVITKQMVDRIHQHRPMPRAHYKAIPVRPCVGAWVHIHETVEQHGRHIRHAHRRAGMARIGRLHRIHAERANGIGHPGFHIGLDLGLLVHVFPPSRTPQARLLSLTRR